MIISGDKLAYMEPQEKVWHGESGQSYLIQDIRSQGKLDSLAPFEGVAGFSAQAGTYHSTLFRFPLRKAPSDLSENCYTVQKLHDLLVALRDEAKFLLLFLRSVQEIEVYEISEFGQQNLSFQVTIHEKDNKCHKRKHFMNELKTASAQAGPLPYCITRSIDLVTDFHVQVTDQFQHTTTVSHWLVTNQVGSLNETVLETAAKEHVFPWVGAALELSDDSSSPITPGGRIFCFLPIPIEASSPLPVHVNGTFGLNDDRRTLKWPTVERQNDPAADWNKLLVSELLPSCYAKLLMEAKNLYPQQFYKAWPVVDAVKPTPWEGLLLPLFTQLFSQAVVWTERTEALRVVGEWITVGEGSFIPKESKVASVVCNALSQSGIKLVDIPPRIWSALHYSRKAVSEVSPRFVRTQLKGNPQSYCYIDEIGKLEILRYCLSDKQYSELPGLALLPLADHTFTAFQAFSWYSQHCCYLCTAECPRHLLPNLDNMLVDLPNDADLSRSLSVVADQQVTQLRKLTVEKLAELIPTSMPPEWRQQQIVSLPHHCFPSEWFQMFWEWVRRKSLKSFTGSLILPISQSSQLYGVEFRVTRLNANSAVVYIPQYASCSPSLTAALDKLQVRFVKVADFLYLEHNELILCLKQFNANGILDAIALSPPTSQLQRVSMTLEEAHSLREFLSSESTSNLNQWQLSTLQNLAIFTTVQSPGGNLYSVTSATNSSLLRKAVVEPENTVVSATHLPPSLLLFSHEYYQVKLLRCLGSSVAFPSNLDFILDYLFPLIQRRVFPDNLLDDLMQEILDMFQILVSRASYGKQQQLLSALQSLPFLKTQSGTRKCPHELFDPSVQLLCELYKSEPVFPTVPFDKTRYLQNLRNCGLRTTVKPQEIVDIICAISTPANIYPQSVDSTKLSRAKAVLEYLSKCDSSTLSIIVTTSYERRSQSYPFSTTLKNLATDRNWLPVCSSPPEDYPSCLVWKGRAFASHFISLSSPVLIPTAHNFHSTSLVVGSQVYLLDSTLPSSVSNIFAAGVPVHHILAHFKEVIHCKHKISTDTMTHIVDLIYKYLQASNKQLQYPQQLHGLKSFPGWIWIRRHSTFVSPDVVAMYQNSSFRHNLEPYIYVLPDDLFRYSDLFSAFGMEHTVTQSQIVSVLSMIKDKGSGSDASEAWQTVMSILNWFTSDGTQEPCLSEKDILYVPVESDSSWPRLMEPSEVVYTDNDFLKQFLASTDESGSYTFVHHRIHPQMAHNLGVTPLSEHLDISEDTFEDAGQYEPLTVRLKNILKDYKDGLTIVKELLQNADDAEATEVNICYDARTHSVKPNSLFFPGMQECHGPALVVHNNATFSQDDFTNITKLAAATKASKALKIGKFGVGFCSVYHITDVPSFVSQDILCIFDPTLSYLNKEIKNPARPGKKVKFASRFIASSNQLVPYTGLFDFDPKIAYSGTMFRFPFRTSASELSGTLYTEATVKELIHDIKECSSKLFLFLQHIKCITVSRINQGEVTPTVLLKITKEEEQHISGALAEVKKLRCLEVQSSQSQEDCWLVATHTDSINTKQTTASVACLLGVTTPGVCYNVKQVEGEIFCFLPLAQKTGLPVHVNSNFAVMNNRRGIWTAEEALKSDPEVQWNMSLMQKVIPKAYHSLLVSLQVMHSQQMLKDYAFYSMWPLERDLTQHNPWVYAVHKLYEEVSSSRLFHSASTNQWLSLQESRFLEPGILCQSSTDPDVLSYVLAIVTHLKLPLVDLPSKYHTHLSLSSSTITEQDFIQLFFKNITQFTNIQQNRNEILQCMFEVYAIGLDHSPTERTNYMGECLAEYPCVPCTPDGSQLKKCDQVIDPQTEFANLFDSAEGMFPIQQFSERHLVVTAMLELGMISETIPWSMVIERAETIAQLYHTNRTKALKRVKLILHCIEFNAKGKQAKQEAKALSTVQFLPVLEKPVHFPLPWFGEDHQLLSGEQLMIKGTTTHRYSFKSADNNINIAGSQVAIVNEASVEEGGCGYINQKTREILQVRNLPSYQEVVNHLKLLISVFNSQQPNSELIDWTNRICRQAYEFLDGQIQQETPTDQAPQLPHGLQELRGLTCVWTGKKFIAIQDVAKEWKLDGPYLYPVPYSLAFRRSLAASLGIKDKFTAEDIVRVLFQMKEDFNDNPVSEACQNLLHELVSQLYNIKPSECSQSIWLPDTSFVMHTSSDLAFNDAPWCKPEEYYKFVNNIIPRRLALQLKVKPVRSKILEKYASQAKLHFQGLPFGQHEELTRRIQNILREYPFDITVLKELLQNADDAKATKMYVILDKRTHGQESVLSEEWQQLQGPALLIWNDSTFSEKDLEGIQQLGLGNKRSDAESIGQYGIGFNVVYHLTDCPSFITGGKTLCIMDPHCHFVPEASTEMPGRRFDDLKSGFWEDFPDLKSSYLQDGLKNCPLELLGGSLFRFPLRHTYNLMRSSKIVDHSTSYINRNEPLTADRMQRYLSDWAPKMKQALLFLNHVTELHFFTIEDHKQLMLSSPGVSYASIPSLFSEHCFEVCIDESGKQSRAHLHEKIAAFKDRRGSEPCVVRYPLTITETLPGTLQKREKKKTEEKWLVQQGIGDLEDKQQTWNYISQVKPKHGIAAPLGSLEHIRAFFGNVFCFLPLSVSCNLPVHVNAHFILNASRRNLWQSTVPGEVDDKSRWNENLLKAVASSYADFLIHARSYYIKSEPFEDLKTLKTSAQCYYSVFPNWSKGPMQDQPVSEGPWFKLAQAVYRKLASLNGIVLATIESTQSTHSTAASVQVPSGPGAQHKVKWHPLKNPESQVYFWATRLGFDDTPLKPILERIGMKLTCAPLGIKNHFHTVECDIPETSPSSVYDYYTQFCGQVSPNGRFPCAVEATAFYSIADFKVFTKYLLQPSESEPGSRVFPKPPFGHPLLLTADGQLRKFDEGNKVISSEYSQLFPKSFERFLHPELLDLKYSSSYFLSPEVDSGSYTTVQEILSKTLSHSLQTTFVHNAEEEHITKSMLTELWVCFSCDETFCLHLEEILRCWALLPSTTNQLFSSTNLLLPILPPSSDSPSDSTHFTLPSLLDFSAVYQVLRHLGMPFLATDIVEHQNVVQNCCPQLSDFKRVLTNLYHLHQQSDLSSTITKDNVTTLITYLQNVNFQVYQEECQSIKALPLFLPIEGNLTSVNGKAVYIWPTNACIIGYSKWVNGKNVVFLDECGVWAKLGPSNLGIEKIPEEKLYVKYIFQSFAKLSETERYQHLEHIRDSLFDSNKFILDSSSKSITSEQKSLARQFVDALKALPCIGREGEQLMCVSRFCTHQKEIFTTFSKHFHFLPKCFTNSEKDCPNWMTFFRAIGLRETVTKQEFQLFCRETADGQNNNLRKASSVLVKYLFSKEATDNAWYDDSMFLSGVSKIPFVCTKSLQELSWIQPVHPAPNTIQRGDEVVHMTKLKGAALSEHGNIVWAVKCVVYLPYKYWQADLLEKLQVLTKPKTADVVNNIIAIAGSYLADFGLFDKYPDECRPPKGAQDLIQIMLQHFEFLATVKDLTSDDLSPLNNLPCIPVYATSQHRFASRYRAVLVKPSLGLSTGDIEEYFPFLHCIPDELFAVHPVLGKIGVKSSLELCHMRIALETAFKCSDQGQLKLEVNTKRVVQKVIKCLFTLLKEQKTSRKSTAVDVEAALNPLYLPSEKGMLVQTQSLLYCDSCNYRNCTLNLKDTGLSLLHLATSGQYEAQDLEEEFCGYLPESIRPKGLSQCCKQVVPKSCTEVDNSSVISLQTALRLHNFPQAILAAIKHVTGNEQLCRCLEPIITQFLQSIRIVAARNLQTDIILLIREPNPLIGSVKCDFHLQQEEASWCFYLDSKISESGPDLMGACQSLAEHLTYVIKTQNTDIPYVNLLELQKLFTNLLMAQTPQQVNSVLYKRGVKFERQDIQFETDITPRLGKPIPESWHHRLDQDIDNLFHPQEWVGYEDREDHFIFVQVIHPVVEDGANSQDVEVRIQMIYKIYVSEDDEEGIEVSALDLYKFLRGKKAGKHAGENKALVPYEGGTDDSWTRREAREETDLKSIKQQICNELREIWKLPSAEKTKAIRRLYLKWHPDKDPDRPILAEEVFKFLLRQIQRLEQGLPLEDPDEPATHGIPSQMPFGSFTSEWSSYFRRWDRTAYQHSRSREGENHYRARGGGGGWEGGGDSGPTHTQFPFDEDFGPQTDQQEGERWVKQAEVDFRTLMKLLNQVSTSHEVSASVCFMAHEVAEKALKGGMYTKCGLGEKSLKSHNLTPLAYALQAKELSSTQGLAGYTIPLEDYYLDTRFPNRYPGSTTIPSDHYSPEDAQQAKENAENILDMMKALVNE